MGWWVVFIGRLNVLAALMEMGAALEFDCIFFFFFDIGSFHPWDLRQVTQLFLCLQFYEDIDCA